MKRSITGFTIVELLIVIVVIAILAAISVVAYTGIQNRASSTAIMSEATQWKKLFDAYKTANGSYPSPVASGDPLTSGGPGGSAQNVYCLGTGFPVSNGDPYCYLVNSTSPHRVLESTGSYINSQLSSIATPPSNTKKYVYNNVTGPFLYYISSTNIQIYGIFPGGTNCLTFGMIAGYSEATRQNCYYNLT